MTRLRIGFRHKSLKTGQLPLFQVWREYWPDDAIEHAVVIWQWWPKWLRLRDGCRE